MTDMNELLLGEEINHVYPFDKGSPMNDVTVLGGGGVKDFVITEQRPQ
jgi:hypothetical protein